MEEFRQCLEAKYHLSQQASCSSVPRHLCRHVKVPFLISKAFVCCFFVLFLKKMDECVLRYFRGQILSVYHFVPLTTELASAFTRIVSDRGSKSPYCGAVLLGRVQL